MIQGNYAYVASAVSNSVQAYDISTGGFVAQGTAFTVTGAKRLVVSGSYLYVFGSTTTARVLSIRNPAALSSAGTFTTSAVAYSGVIGGRYLYTAEAGMVEMFDLASPASPISMGTTAVTGMGSGSIPTDQMMILNGRHLYVSDYSGGKVHQFDVGGLYTSVAQAGSVDTSIASVSQTLSVGQGATINGALSIGMSASVAGDLGVGGSITAKNATATIFTADAANTRVQIGSNTTDANAVLLVLDSYNAATDPVGGAAGGNVLQHFDVAFPLL